MSVVYSVYSERAASLPGWSNQLTRALPGSDQELRVPYSSYYLAVPGTVELQLPARGNQEEGGREEGEKREQGKGR